MSSSTAPRGSKRQRSPSSSPSRSSKRTRGPMPAKSKKKSRQYHLRRDEVPEDAGKLQEAMNLHCRLLMGLIGAASLPESPSEEDIKAFEERFDDASKINLILQGSSSSPESLRKAEASIRELRKKVAIEPHAPKTLRLRALIQSESPTLPWWYPVQDVSYLNAPKTLGLRALVHSQFPTLPWWYPVQDASYLNAPKTLGLRALIQSESPTLPWWYPVQDASYLSAPKTLRLRALIQSESPTLPWWYPVQDASYLSAPKTSRLRALIHLQFPTIPCLMNDEILRCRIEYHLGWYPDSLDTPHGRMVVSQTRFLIMSYFHAAATSVAIRFAILGIALESIRLYLEL
ncbi:hypothetical protein EYR40_008321 [Pleurotus pulmonarius]|nr:hypothetical protein EYR40_008321 [Pleurotus pulmonarius]